MKTALAVIPTKIEELITAHRGDLEEAWANCGEGETLSISFPVKIGFKKGKPMCEVGISFVLQKCVDSVEFEWSDKQIHLFNSPDVKSIHAAGMAKGQ